MGLSLWSTPDFRVTWTEEIKGFEEGDVIGLDYERPGQIMVVRRMVAHYLDVAWTPAPQPAWQWGCDSSSRPKVSAYNIR